MIGGYTVLNAVHPMQVTIYRAWMSMYVSCFETFILEKAQW